MSLAWSISKVKDYEELADDEWERIVTQVICFRTMSVGMGSITEANHEAWFRRSLLVEAVFGVGAHKDGEDYAITFADVRRRIGLRTNADRMTDKAFIHHVTQWG